MRVCVLGSATRSGTTAELSQNSTPAPAFLQKVTKKLSLGIAHGGGLAELGWKPAGSGSQYPRADEPVLAVARWLSARGRNESGNWPPALCHQDLLAVLDADKIRRERGFQFRNGRSLHETIMVFSIRDI